MEFDPEGVNKAYRLERAPKAYDNKDFIHSRDGRTIRLISEYLYPEQYLRKYGVKGVIVFYGSARSMSLDDYNAKMRYLKDELDKSKDEEIRESYRKQIEMHEKQIGITETYEDVVKLSKMMAEWTMSLPENHRYLVCSGGGPGMMEAANRGAYKAGHPNIGFNISLPFEQYPNQFITPDLNFEFHYFFMRKFWFVYLAKAMVATPGGFGTLDELLEILTLKQTHKVTKPIPIVLYNEEFWRNLINFDYLVETGMISPGDVDLFEYCNTPEEAFEYLKKELIKGYKIPVE